ncbi:hypothetical protein [Shewanella sp. 6_MG-2023]|uniref:hypothetical protein n=1 Tax=Shewanella sp. 6_MG-2023 TaxID=3062660 RepID=UPI0026E2EE8E|nr:hypothetical protein [Shewanella sp. 6_MG-2023]MDO6621080.1 hypothetical protein [Shewanella sp. 6_MG-2023]
MIEPGVHPNKSEQEKLSKFDYNTFCLIGCLVFKQKFLGEHIMPRPITELTKQELNALENNYQRLNKTAGGIYSLIEVRRELQRREGGKFDGKQSLKQF